MINMKRVRSVVKRKKGKKEITGSRMKIETEEVKFRDIGNSGHQLRSS
jgi:hypothetical protein